jgi:hypothetical protein
MAGRGESLKPHEQMARELRDGEQLRAVIPAFAPSPDSGSGFVPAIMIPVIAVVERWHWRRTTRSTAERSLFPLAPRMLLGLTDRRLLVWSSRRNWRLGNFLGDVALDRIVDAQAPTVGTGARSVTVHLANEPSVTFKVPGDVADQLANALAGRDHRDF